MKICIRPPLWSTRRLIPAALLVTICVPLVASAEPAGSRSSAVGNGSETLVSANERAVPEKKRESGPQKASGMRIYVDPETGDLLPPPAGGPRSAGVGASEPGTFDTSREGLDEVPGTSPAGGVKLDLRGRFRSAVMANETADGKIVTECQSADVERVR